jgi:hypothetical protein
LAVALIAYGVYAIAERQGTFSRSRRRLRHHRGNGMDGMLMGDSFRESPFEFFLVESM